MATKVNLNTWQRGEHFSFFNNFTDPFFSVCVRIKAASLYHACKHTNHSFYLACLYACMRANNRYDAMRYRIKGETVWRVNNIHVNAVQLDENNLFKFSFLPYTKDFDDFCKLGKAAFSDAVNASFLSEKFKQNEDRLNCIHVSVLPWLDFSSFSHASPFGEQNGIPKFVFGKFDAQSGSMALNIDVHHGLLDGFHVAQFVNQLNTEIHQLCELLTKKS